jgi:AcrR family transcriptional regulator
MERPSTTPSAYHHGDLRNALITEGRRLLEEMGARELSVRHVARSVGVSIAAPSHHFDGKEGLLAAIAADGFNELASLRRKIAASEQDPLRKAWRMMECYVRFAERQKGLFDLMVGPRILLRNDKELTGAAAASFDLFASSVCDYARTRGWREEDLNLVVHAAWSVEHGLATLILAHRVPFPGRKVDLKRMVHFSVSMMLGAIAAGPEHVTRIVESTS